jgi:hypothetical protein
MNNLMLNGVSIHEWVRHPEVNGSIFHAYLARVPGTPSVCGGHPVINQMSEMDIPGDVSICCVQCFAKLYRLDKWHYPIFRSK